MRAPTAAVVLLAGCLSTPPDRVGGDDSDEVDAASDPDAPFAACPTSLDLPLTGASDLGGWGEMPGLFCSHQVTGLGLEFTNQGSPSICSRYADRLVDLTGRRLRVRLHDGNADLAMSISLVVGSLEVPFNERRWLYFDRDQGQLLFGECNPDIPGLCDDTFWGSVTYDASKHQWLSFSHQAGDDYLVFETSEDGVIFEPEDAAGGVTAADVACVGVDLGSYEEDKSGVTASSSFSDLGTD